MIHEFGDSYERIYSKKKEAMNNDIDKFRRNVKSYNS